MLWQLAGLLELLQPDCCVRPTGTLPSRLPHTLSPGDKLLKSKELDNGYSLPPIVHAFHGSKVSLGHKLQQWQSKELQPLVVSLIGVDEAPYGHTPQRFRQRK